MTPIFTIGHSVHPFAAFVGLLSRHQIEFVIDVRSSPYSRHAPHFNKQCLSNELPSYGIKYAHFGDGLGARRTERHLLDSVGRVDFSKVRETAAFRTAIDRIKTGASQGYRLSLMCSEGNPFECHRFALISYQLAREGSEVLHIMRDGQLKTQVVLESELLTKYAERIPQPTIFEPNVDRAAQLEAAYQLLNSDIGWSDTRVEAAV
ncbi:MAG: DUF488 domain-containing protein [Verrucomicrobiota bacterium]|nr:DUF488 domain-containing protein [Verrucomicrobiota bacterium]